jgi:hypothetical protein
VNAHTGDDQAIPGYGDQELLRGQRIREAEELFKVGYLQSDAEKER